MLSQLYTLRGRIPKLSAIEPVDTFAALRASFKRATNNFFKFSIKTFLKIILPICLTYQAKCVSIIWGSLSHRLSTIMTYRLVIVLLLVAIIFALVLVFYFRIKICEQPRCAGGE